MKAGAHRMANTVKVCSRSNGDMKCSCSVPAAVEFVGRGAVRESLSGQQRRRKMTSTSTTGEPKISVCIQFVG